jgi:hypothetical protein
MNQQHNKIKFELEHPDEKNTLRLLDFAITLNNEASPQFDFYKKKARRDIFVNANSALPWSAKMNVIKNEKQRIRERCTGNNVENLRTHLTAFDKTLSRNGYAQQTINRCNTQPKRRNRAKVDGDVHFFQMPFISDRLNQKVKRIFQQEGINTIVYSKNKNLRHTLTRKHNEISTCTLSTCPISDPKLCYRTNVIYQIQCSACKKRYIGSTIRQLHQRTKEHLTSDQSSVKRHLSTCNPTARIDVKVLSHDNDEKNLRLREAILIMDLKPELNAKDEEQALLSLVQPVKRIT